MGARLVFVLLVAMVGCSGATEDPETGRHLAELDEAVEAWESGDRSDYSYVYLRTCRCAEPEPQGPNTVFVVDGNVDSVEHFGSREALDGFSAQNLFERTRQAITEGQEVAVVYDTVTGLPSSLHLDVGAGAGDDPLILEIHSFVSYAEHRSALAAARMRWQASGLADYRIRYEVPLTGPVEVEVRDGLVTASSESAASARTVADFFDELDAALGDRPDRIAIEYDPDLGHPTSYRIETLTDRRVVVQYESIEVTR